MVLLKMKYLFYIVFFLFSSNTLANPNYIVDCQTNAAESESSVTYILNIKKGMAEILYSKNTHKGVLGTDEHFYTLYFTYNKKTKNEIVTTTVINRITGELTESATSASSYPEPVGKAITGKCKSKEYVRKL